MKKLNHFLHIQLEVSELTNFHIPLILLSPQGPPPQPVYACSLSSDSRSVMFNWENGFNTVDHYSVTPGFHFINCSTCNMPLAAHTTPCACTALQSGMFNFLNVTAFNCGDQQGTNSIVGINLTSMTTILLYSRNIYFHRRNFSP